MVANVCTLGLLGDVDMVPVVWPPSSMLWTSREAVSCLAALSKFLPCVNWPERACFYIPDLTRSCLPIWLRRYWRPGGLGGDKARGFTIWEECWDG